MSLRSKVIRLAYQQPELREHLLPLIKVALGVGTLVKSKEHADQILNADWKSWKRVRLPEKNEVFFNRVQGTISVPIKNLRPIRSRVGGIIRANRNMWLTYNGYGKKRDPISLRKIDENTYEVADGNSTYRNAKDSGWKNIWGVVVEDVSKNSLLP